MICRCFQSQLIGQQQWKCISQLVASHDSAKPIVRHNLRALRLDGVKLAAATAKLYERPSARFACDRVGTRLHAGLFDFAAGSFTDVYVAHDAVLSVDKDLDYVRAEGYRYSSALDPIKLLQVKLRIQIYQRLADFGGSQDSDGSPLIPMYYYRTRSFSRCSARISTDTPVHGAKLTISLSIRPSHWAT